MFRFLKPISHGYPEVSRRTNLMLSPLPRTLVAPMPKRMVLLPSEDFHCYHQILGCDILPRTSVWPRTSVFPTSCIQKDSKGMNVALTICSAGDLNAQEWYCSRRWCWQDGNSSSPFWGPGAVSECPLLCQPCSQSLLAWALDSFAVPCKVIACKLQNIWNVCSHSFMAHTELLSRI